ncbi:unnamed protein product [Timema podura]|uniref:Uncharacterized protein n=1 Tax=Timema podura TaxID=61482 RepID=A0ABN7PJ76_TIMPD|nr:unnamed protein product [Timema podura]
MSELLLSQNKFHKIKAVKMIKRTANWWTP